MATNWTIAVAKTAHRELNELPDAAREEAIDILVGLMDDPCPPDAEPMRGPPNRFRIRFHNQGYRLIYQVSEQKGRVIVLRARPRATAYIGL